MRPWLQMWFSQPGECHCNTGWKGAKCDECVPHWDCPQQGLDACIYPNDCICKDIHQYHCFETYFTGCGCDKRGMERCGKNNTCVCKANFTGEKCHRCQDNYFRFPFCEGIIYTIFDRNFKLFSSNQMFGFFYFQRFDEFFPQFPFSRKKCLSQFQFFSSNQMFVYFQRFDEFFPQFHFFIFARQIKSLSTIPYFLQAIY